MVYSRCTAYNGDDDDDDDDDELQYAQHNWECEWECARVTPAMFNRLRLHVLYIAVRFIFESHIIGYTAWRVTQVTDLSFGDRT